MPVPVISIAQMREWENATWATGQTEEAVIQEVGRLLARRALALTQEHEAILILAGKGHNGDDARCAQPHLPQRRVELLQVTDPATALPSLRTALAHRPALVVDGLFGIGLKRPLERDWSEVVDTINAAALPVLAVDVPSGLQADTGEPLGAAIRATVTVTLAAPKRGLLLPHAWEYVGRLEVEPKIGLTACPCTSPMWWVLPEDFQGFPPVRPVAGHKGTFGHTTVFGGSPGYHGAAVLAACAAQRAQPGLITLFTPPAVYGPVASQLQAVMVHPWTRESRCPDSTTAVLFGPGLAAPDLPVEYRSFLVECWQNAPLPVVVDASGLDWLPAGPVPRDALRVITPHPGEAARLLGCRPAAVQADRPAALRELSARHGQCWVVLKGHQTLIGRSEGPIFVNSSGNPFLAQGGSGDVLAGYLAGLIGQPALQGDPSMALRYAVWQHGAAADLLSRHKPNWVVEDLLAVLGLAR